MGKHENIVRKIHKIEHETKPKFNAMINMFFKKHKLDKLYERHEQLIDKYNDLNYEQLYDVIELTHKIRKIKLRIQPELDTLIKNYNDKHGLTELYKQHDENEKLLIQELGAIDEYLLISNS